MISEEVPIHVSSIDIFGSLIFPASRIDVSTRDTKFINHTSKLLPCYLECHITSASTGRYGNDNEKYVHLYRQYHIDNVMHYVFFQNFMKPPQFCHGLL